MSAKKTGHTRHMTADEKHSSEQEREKSALLQVLAESELMNCHGLLYEEDIAGRYYEHATGDFLAS